MTRSLLCLAISALSLTALAVPAPLIHVKPNQVSSPFSSGSTVGGRSADEFSLLGVKSEAMSEGSERLSILFGDRFGKPIKGDPGYFHVALERGGRRIVIDLAQVQKTAIDPAQLTKALGGSKLISASEMLMDPMDHSTNITLETRKPVRLRVGSISGEPAKLVVELEVAEGANAAARAGERK